IPAKNGVTETRTYIVTTTDTGLQKIPVFKYSYTRPNRKPDTVSSTGNTMIRIISINVDTTAGYKPIKPIIAVEVPQETSNTVYYIMAASVIACGILLFFLFSNRRKTGERKDKEVIKSLHRRTLDKLDKLDKESNWTEA